ncbi:hypothetical protein IEN85_13965 [Pelagicoccus sp. NFK12]|uniref:Uncharacterized protein n=1 Tax=Pelagicoccus enzymogenes TaxID=2773457 RepID=A0A927FBX0_9BACT|nr:hypothetical protein [Pelagicoccus enzymogenes]MBD5780603.1 hypothetical protein [Pelagicoccus enzymogenes]MDQ8198996.1 hypothetical protein [Pelagicoccus enzymogenes]
MNSINRLEETWTPKWDLGLQDEFGFTLEESVEVASKHLTERPNAWAMASREVLNRQSPSEGVATNAGTTNREQLVRFLEALSVEISGNE